MPFSVASSTDRGRVRSNNEDTVYPQTPVAPAQAWTERGCLITVCDGVGGQAAGEVASATAIARLVEAYYGGPPREPSEALAYAVREANRAVFDAARRTDRMGMASTVVAAVLQPGQVTVANAGDSRAYLIGPSGARLITRDHTPVAELLAGGVLTQAEAEAHPQRHMLYRSLGLKEDVDFDLKTYPLAPGETILLCSDGLSNQVPPQVMAETVAAFPLQIAADRLIQLANQAGGEDNASVVLAREGNSSTAAAPRAFTAVSQSSRKYLMPLIIAILATVLVVMVALIAAAGRSSSSGAAPATRQPAVQPPLKENTQGAIREIPNTRAPVTPAVVAIEAASPCKEGGRLAALRDPNGKSTYTFIYRLPNDNSGLAKISFSENRHLCVIGSPEPGDSTFVLPEGGKKASSWWYRASLDGFDGYVACPYVFFLDTQEHAKCENE